jgi:hypothetical protein
MEENKINSKERVSVIRAMDTIVRSLNDGRDVLWWFEYGVPDGEINEETTDDELLWLVDDDKLFADIMSTFIKIMKRQPINGAMWVDNVLSQNKKNIK